MQEVQKNSDIQNESFGSKLEYYKNVVYTKAMSILSYISEISFVKYFVDRLHDVLFHARELSELEKAIKKLESKIGDIALPKVDGEPEAKKTDTKVKSDIESDVQIRSDGEPEAKEKTDDTEVKSDIEHDVQIRSDGESEAVIQEVPSVGADKTEEVPPAGAEDKKDDTESLDGNDNGKVSMTPFEFFRLTLELQRKIGSNPPVTESDTNDNIEESDWAKIVRGEKELQRKIGDKDFVVKASEIASTFEKPKIDDEPEAKEDTEVKSDIERDAQIRNDGESSTVIQEVLPVVNTETDSEMTLNGVDNSTVTN